MRYMETQRDLFSLPDYYTLVHCIAQDALMGAGIAVQFAERNPQMREYIRSVNPEVGSIVPYTNLEGQGHPVVNMITKSSSYGKPTRDDFNLSLFALAEYCSSRGITKLAMPKIGSGLDKLSWTETTAYINFYFNEIEIDICVCDFKPPNYSWR